MAKAKWIDIDEKIAQDEEIERNTAAMRARDAAARNTAGLRATGALIGARVRIVEICHEQRHLIGCAGTVVRYCGGGRRIWELEVRMDQPCPTLGPLWALPTWCWALEEQ